MRIQYSNAHTTQTFLAAYIKMAALHAT